MDFSYMLDGTEMTVYECSKRSGIPYSTLSDIMKGKTPIDKVNFRTAYYLAHTLGVPMEDLYEQMHVPERTCFETFKSQARHDVKLLGDSEFVQRTARSKAIMKYWHLEWLLEAFYLLGMVDYLCRVNNLALLHEYDELRNYKLPETVYPDDIVLSAMLSPDLDIRAQARDQSIPEFIRFNIVEKDIRNVY